MITRFPAMDGPFANEFTDTHYLTGYSIGKDSIYIDFRWSVAEEAYETALRLSKKHKIGFFDVISSEGDILFYENEQLKSIEGKDITLISIDSTKKPWWKFW